MENVMTICQRLDKEKKGILLLGYDKRMSKYAACHVDGDTLHEGGSVQVGMKAADVFLTEAEIICLTICGKAVYAYDEPHQKIGARVYSYLTTDADRTKPDRLGIPIL